MEKIESTSLNIEKENINKIKELFPEAVEEGKIDFDVLRELLGDEVDESREKYQFSWKGKAESIKIAQSPTKLTLRPVKNASKNWNSTENIYIEGDNLEVLKQLQKTYSGNVKMIYIDPPYNTGKDRVYKDKLEQNIDDYLNQTEQECSSNPESNGRFHTDWLNMMYPRLMLAKNLLKRDGVIFISMDDHEISNLKTICNEIFGETNFEGHIHWRRRHNQPNDKTKMVGIVAEHILCYAKDSKYLKTVGVGKLGVTAKFTNPDNDPRGPWASKPWKVGSGQTGSHYVIISPTGKKFEDDWMGEEKTYLKLMEEDKIYFPKNGDGVPRKKYYKFEREDEGQCANNWWGFEQFGSNQEASDCLYSLFGIKDIFSNPKPIKLLKSLIKIANVKDGETVLDFFSGSASTAHAIMDLNSEYNKTIKYILVQLPQPLDEKEPATQLDLQNICELGEERIRRAGEQIKTNWEKENESEGLFATDEQFNTDIGFKVFKLDSTNINEWDSSLKLEDKQLAEKYGKVFKDGRTDEDVLYEIMLKYGVFDQKVKEIQVNNKTMYKVGEDTVVCLDDYISESDIKCISELKPKKVIFKESGFNTDNDKINAIYNLEKAGVEDIKSI